MEKGIPEKDDFINDFFLCLKKRVGEKRSNSVTAADFEVIANQAADDLGDFDNVPEVYDHFTRAVVKNMVPSFVDCVFSINE
ncbi:MAG: hypothetical protein KGI39_03570, partial [Patescibacteria group bacterium]|nr:hypothetical protein [Patescibacteria group bacterium]